MVRLTCLSIAMILTTTTSSAAFHIRTSCQRSPPTTLAAKSKAVLKSKVHTKKKQHSLQDLLTLETNLRSRYEYIIGCDDAGGAACIAGPVVCASCCVLQPFSTFLPISEESPSVPTEVVDILSNVNDSKMLSREQCHTIYNTIISHPELFAVSVAHRSALQIDEVNLLRATQLGILVIHILTSLKLSRCFAMLAKKFFLSQHSVRRIN